MNDLISRQAVIYAMAELQGRASTKAELKGISKAWKRIKQLPSAEPARKKGRWILHETMNDRYVDMICPFCRKSYTVDANRIDDIGFTAEDFNFCPNCGEDMREGDTT